MGGGCSSLSHSPRVGIYCVDPPLEVLLLSDGCSPDSTLLSYLTSLSWLHDSQLLSLPGRPHKQQLHKDTPTQLFITAKPPLPVVRRRHSAAAAIMPHTVDESKHTLTQRIYSQTPHLGARSVTAATATTTHNNNNISNTGGQLSPSNGNAVLSPSPAAAADMMTSSPILFVVCDARLISLRFHICSDYHHLLKRKTTSLQKQRTHQVHPQRRNSMLMEIAPLISSHPLDGCLCFISTQDATQTARVLIGGIRPLLKRPTHSQQPHHYTHFGSQSQPPTHRGSRIETTMGTVIPFMLLGVEDKSVSDAEETVKKYSPTGHQQRGRSLSCVSSTSGRLNRLNLNTQTHRDNTTATTAEQTVASDTTSASTTTSNSPPAAAESISLILPPAAAALASGRRSCSLGAVGRPLTVDDGLCLSIDAGACGYAQVDLTNGHRVDEAIKHLIGIMEKDRTHRRQTQMQLPQTHSAT